MVGAVPGTEGLRGVLAARNIVKGEAVVSVLFKQAVGIGLANLSAQVRCCSPRCLHAEDHNTGSAPCGRLWQLGDWPLFGGFCETRRLLLQKMTGQGSMLGPGVACSKPTCRCCEAARFPARSNRLPLAAVHVWCIMKGTVQPSGC